MDLIDVLELDTPVYTGYLDAMRQMWGTVISDNPPRSHTQRRSQVRVLFRPLKTPTCGGFCLFLLIVTLNV